MKTWPTFLPIPSQQYSSEVDPFLAVTQFDAGNVRQRRRYTGAQERIQVVWRFDSFEYDLFRAFVDSLEAGSMSFSIPILGQGGIETREVFLYEGKTSQSNVSFGHYDVSAVLLAKPQTPIQFYDFLVDLETDDFTEFITTSNVLWLYVETVFGQSENSSEVTAFLETYS